MQLCRRLSLLAVAAAVAVSAAATTTAASADPGGVPDDPHCDAPSHSSLTLGIFSRLPDLAVADRAGFFAAQGLTVTFSQVTSSADAFGRLVEPKPGQVPLDLLMTSVDNVANYRLNASNSLGRTVPVTAVAGNDGGYNLSLWSNQPSYAAYASAGKAAQFAVDAPASGFAYVGYALLEAQGIAKDDYTIVTRGGTGSRYAYLTSTPPTTTAATLLNQGFDVHAALAGSPYTQLGSVGDVAPQYLGNTVVGLDPYLQGEGRCTAVKFVRALLGAAQFTLDPANEAAVKAAIASTDTVKPDPQLSDWVDRYYAITTTPGTGQSPDLSIDRAGLASVLALRDRYAGFDAPQDLQVLDTPAGGLFDTDVLHAAQHGRE